MSKGWKVFITLALAMLMALIGGAGYVTWSLLDGNKSNVVMAQPQVPSPTLKPTVDSTPKVETPKVRTNDIIASDSGKIYVLALGIDTRDNDFTGRTDTMMVISIDRKNDRMDLIGIPRDSYVELAGKGNYDKINHAYAFGGVEMAQKTVEGLLGIKIDHYVLFNFTSFMKVIDSLGGIEVNVPYDFTEQDSKGIHDAMVFTKGLQTLDAEHALAFARMRHQDPTGDVGRSERQQVVVKAALNKLVNSPISRYTDIYNAIKGSIATDVSIFDLPGLSLYAKNYGIINTYTLKGSDSIIDDIYYYKLDEVAINEIRSILK